MSEALERTDDDQGSGSLYVTRPPTSDPRSLMPDTWLLISLRWQVAWNGFNSRKLSSKILTILVGLWFALVAVGISAVVGGGAGFFVRNLTDRHYDAIIPGAILTFIAVLLLFSSFGIALGSLFLASDLELLMTAPVDRRAVFISKILDGIAFYYLLTVLIAVPALIAYGAGLGYGPLYYGLLPIAVLGVPLIPAGLGALLVLVVARVAPARRVREVLGLAGALVGIACGLIGQTSRFWFRPGATGRPEEWLDRLRGLQDLPIPSIIVGRALAGAGQNDLLPAFAATLAFVAITLGGFAGCVWVADRLYSTGWVRMQSSGTSQRGRQRTEKVARNAGLLGRAPAYAAITLKDWRVIPRDLRNFAQILSPLVFLPIIYLNLVNGPRGVSGRGSAFDMSDFSGVLIAAGILGSTVLIFGRIAGTGISMEGKSWWLLKAAPLSSDEIVFGKYLGVLLPFAVLSTLLLFGAALWRHFNPGWALYGWYGVETLGAAMLAIELGLAVPWARLDWDDPRKMGSGVGALLAILAWVGLAVTSGLLLCLPLFAQAVDQTLVFEAAIAGAALSSVVSFGVGYLVLKFGISRLARVGEAGT